MYKLYSKKYHATHDKSLFFLTWCLQSGELAVSMLKKWLSSYGHPSTTAGPIIASTITIEAIQDLLHANGFPIEGIYVWFTDNKMLLHVLC